MYETSSATPKSRSDVFAFWRSTPLTRAITARSVGSSPVATTGPRGLKVSNPLPTSSAPHGHLGALDDALTDVVAARISQHVVQRVLLADPPGLFADDDGKLGLVLDLLPLVRVDDGVARPDYGRERLHEQHGEGRLGQAHLLDV